MQKNIIGLDIGGTKIALGLVTRQGKIIKKIEFQTEPQKRFEEVIKNIILGLKKLKVTQIGKVGIGIAGQIDSQTGKIIFSPNIPKWKNIPVAKLLTKKLGLEFKQEKNFEIKIGNDANCFALAENIFGAGQKTKHMIGITLGTGIGGGLICNGKLYVGQGYAAELGHMILVSQGRRCPCGKKGCLEAYASGKAIENTYFKITKKKKSAIEIENEAFVKGEKSFAFKIYKEAGKYLGVGLSNLINILDPELIVLGGGLGRSRLLLKFAKEGILKNTFFKKRKTNIVQAKLGKEAGIIGAALLVR